jgi:hypothetical protein
VVRSDVPPSRRPRWARGSRRTEAPSRTARGGPTLRHCAVTARRRRIGASGAVSLAVMPMQVEFLEPWNAVAAGVVLSNESCAASLPRGTYSTADPCVPSRVATTAMMSSSS